MSLDLLFGLIFGFFFGFIFAPFCFTNSGNKKRKKKKDPADWWKHGGNPFDHNFRD